MVYLRAAAMYNELPNVLQRKASRWSTYRALSLVFFILLSQSIWLVYRTHEGNGRTWTGTYSRTYHSLCLIWFFICGGVRTPYLPVLDTGVHSLWLACVRAGHWADSNLGQGLSLCKTHIHHILYIDVPISRRSSWPYCCLPAHSYQTVMVWDITRDDSRSAYDIRMTVTVYMKADWTR